MESILLIAGWLFVLTHIDTLLVLVAFAVDDDYRKREILLGHYFSFAFGLSTAIVGSVLAVEVLSGNTYLFGVIPLSLGLGGLLRRHPEVKIDSDQIVTGTIGRIGIITSAGIGLSGENLALFIPFFAGLSVAEIGFISGLYLIAAGVVYLLALVLAQATSSVGIPFWLDRYLVPTVLTVVGIYILSTGWIV